MKTNAILIFAIIFFYSCKANDPVPFTEDEDVTWIDSTKYIYRIKGSIDSLPYGNNNSLFVRNDSAWILHSDMLQLMMYSHSGDTITLQNFEEREFNDQVYKFLVLHPDTIKKIPSNELWIKRGK